MSQEVSRLASDGRRILGLVTWGLFWTLSFHLVADLRYWSLGTAWSLWTRPSWTLEYVRNGLWMGFAGSVPCGLVLRRLRGLEQVLVMSACVGIWLYCEYPPNKYVIAGWCGLYLGSACIALGALVNLLGPKNDMRRWLLAAILGAVVGGNAVCDSYDHGSPDMRHPGRIMWCLPFALLGLAAVPPQRWVSTRAEGTKTSTCGKHICPE